MGSKIGCIGDSVILGRIDPVNQGWVGLLRSWHVKRNPSSNMVYNLGIGGNTSRDILKRFSFECESRKLDAIIIGYGLNDMRRLEKPSGRYLVPLDDFSDCTTRIFEKAKLITPNVAFSQMPRIREKLLQPHKGQYWNESDWNVYSRLILDLCRNNGIHLIEHNPPSSIKGDDLTADGLHPTTVIHEHIFHSAKTWVLSKDL